MNCFEIFEIFENFEILKFLLYIVSVLLNERVTVISIIDFARECNIIFSFHRNCILLINMLENGMSRVLLLANRKTAK
jgi:hypothetical protein